MCCPVNDKNVQFFVQFSAKTYILLCVFVLECDTEWKVLIYFIFDGKEILSIFVVHIARRNPIWVLRVGADILFLKSVYLRSFLALGNLENFNWSQD